ncbi:hypothetical protein THAOC_08301, partial [Thalassiosira oceanica]
ISFWGKKAEIETDLRRSPLRLADPVQSQVDPLRYGVERDEPTLILLADGRVRSLLVAESQPSGDAGRAQAQEKGDYGWPEALHSSPLGPLGQSRLPVDNECTR